MNKYLPQRVLRLSVRSNQNILLPAWQNEVTPGSKMATAIMPNSRLKKTDVPNPMVDVTDRQGVHREHFMDAFWYLEEVCLFIPTLGYMFHR